jgi:RNA polymerase sigma-70 factor (ECF subfamily)
MLTEALAQGVRAGRSSALEKLYDTYAAPLHKYVLSLLWSRQDAEDAVQNVFVKLVGMVRGGRCRVEDMKNYMFRAARNEALTIRTRRRMGRDVEKLREEGMIIETAPGADPLEAARVEEALARLPVEQREVIVLKVYHGFTFAEIAELVGEKLNTVASRYKYAIAKLERWIGPRQEEKR